jgi:WD40 repeat protein
MRYKTTTVTASALNILLVPPRLGWLVLIATILAGCSPSPSRTVNEQTTATESRQATRPTRLPATPTLASHDVTNSQVIDGSKATRVQWPIASGTAEPASVIEVNPSLDLRWSADYPLAKIHDLAWSPDGQFLAVGGMTHDSDKTLFRSPTRLYSEDGTVTGELFTDSRVGSGVDGSISDLEWSSDGRVLATAGGLNQSVTLFSPPSNRKIELTYVAISIHAVRFSPDGKYVVFVTGDRDLYLYDAEGNRLDVVGPAGASVHSVAWHPDGTKLACSDPLGVMIWGLRVNSSTEDSSESVSLVPLVRVNLPLGKEQWVTTLDWNQDGSRLAVGAFGTGDVWLIDRDAAPLATLRGHTESVWRTCFSSNGILATTSSDATTRLWDHDGNPIAVLASATPQEDILIDVVAWSPSGDLLAVASPDDLIRIYNRDAVPLANLRGHRGIVQAVSWHPHSERLASADDKGITYIWKLPTKLQ